MNLGQDFLEKFILLIVTAVLTGFLVPYILRRIDERKSKEQTALEAELARQTKVIEAQSTFLDDISRLLWRWRNLCLKVAYYGSENNLRNYSSARKDFDINIWDLYHNIRAEISKSQRLISENAYADLYSLYSDMHSIDEKLSTLIEIERPDESSSELFLVLIEDIHSQVSARIDEVLNALAGELQLKGNGHPGKEKVMSQRQLELQIEKLELEVKHLKSKWQRWSGRAIPIVTACIAVFGFWWSVKSFNVQQREAQTWRKAEFIARTVNDFDSSPKVQNAKLMLDSLKLRSKGRKIELFPDEADVNRKYVNVTPDDICAALAKNKEAVESQGQRLDKLIAISDSFDLFLSYLDQFEHDINIGLLNADDVKLDLIYWISLLNNDLKPEFKDRIWEYSDRFGFSGVRSFSNRYGFPDYKGAQAANNCVGV